MTHLQSDRWTNDAEPGSHAGRAPLFVRSAGKAGRAARREQGQAITEFAMVLPVIAFLAFVLVMFGRVLFDYIQLTHAANEGARLASVNQPSSGTLCTLLHSAYTLPSGASVTISYPSGQAVGDPVTVDVSTSSSWVPVVPSFNLHAAATMRLEQPVPSALASCST
jgi:TadE-like protein